MITLHNYTITISFSIYQEQHTTWSSFLVHWCKMMISPGVFFIFFYFLFFGLLGNKRTKNNLKWKIAINPPHTKSQEQYSIWSCFWYSCVKWWYLQEFFSFFSKFWFGWLGVGEGVNRVKNGAKWEKRIWCTCVKW